MEVGFCVNLLVHDLRCALLTKRCVHDKGIAKGTSLSGGVDGCHFEHVGGVGCESSRSEGVKSGLDCGLVSIG